MIYSISGGTINNAYDAAGDKVENAYDKHGNSVYRSEKHWDYSNYSISDMFTYSASYFQGFSIYGDKIAQVREGYALYIIGLVSENKIKEVSMDMGHGNSCQFSDEFFGLDDEFPLFYIRNEGIWVYRIVGTTSVLIKKYSFSADQVGTYVAGFGLDCGNRKLYTASYTEGDYITKTGKLRVCEWDMDDTTEVESGVYEMQLLRSNDIVWFNDYDAIQGCCCHDGSFFITTGMTANQNVVIINQTSLEISHSILVDTSGEIEGCAWAGDEFLVVGQRKNPYIYKKIVFAAE